MYYICHLAKDIEQFVVYDKESFKPEDFELEPVKEITIEELKSDYNLLPIIKLNEFLLGVLAKKKRTISRILAECGIETFKAFEYERDLVHSKKSKLTRAQREMVLDRYDDIVTSVTEHKEEEPKEEVTQE